LNHPTQANNDTPPLLSTPKRDQVAINHQCQQPFQKAKAVDFRIKCRRIPVNDFADHTLPALPPARGHFRRNGREEKRSNPASKFALTVDGYPAALNIYRVSVGGHQPVKKNCDQRHHIH